MHTHVCRRHSSRICASARLVRTTTFCCLCHRRRPHLGCLFVGSPLVVVAVASSLFGLAIVSPTCLSGCLCCLPACAPPCPLRWAGLFLRLFCFGWLSRRHVACVCVHGSCSSCDRVASQNLRRGLASRASALVKARARATPNWSTTRTAAACARCRTAPAWLPAGPTTRPSSCGGSCLR